MCRARNCKGITTPQFLHEDFGILENSGALWGRGLASSSSCSGTMYRICLPLVVAVLRSRVFASSF